MMVCNQMKCSAIALKQTFLCCSFFLSTVGPLGMKSSGIFNDIQHTTYNNVVEVVVFVVEVIVLFSATLQLYGRCGLDLSKLI